MVTPKYTTNNLFTIRKISPKLLDIFLNETSSKSGIVGFEPQGWLRLQKRGLVWVQTAGAKIPSWKFKFITEELNK
jgi:hypothetical protein